MHFHPRLFSNKSALKDIYGHGGISPRRIASSLDFRKRKTNVRPSPKEAVLLPVDVSLRLMSLIKMAARQIKVCSDIFPPQSPKCSPRTNFDDDVFSSLAPCFPFLSPRIGPHLTVIKLEISLTRAVNSSEIWDLYNPRFIQSYVNSQACKKMKIRLKTRALTASYVLYCVLQPRTTKKHDFSALPPLQNKIRGYTFEKKDILVFCVP